MEINGTKFKNERVDNVFRSALLIGLRCTPFFGQKIGVVKVFSKGRR